MILDDANLLGDELLNIAEESGIVMVTKGYRHPLRTRSPRTTDAVDVGLGDIRDVIVDHVFELIDIDPTRGNIGRDEDARRAILEVCKRALTIVL